MTSALERYPQHRQRKRSWKRPSRTPTRRDRKILLTTLKPPSLISQSIQQGSLILKSTWDNTRNALLDFWRREGFSENVEGTKLKRRDVVIDARWKFKHMGAALLPAILLILFMELWGKDNVHRRMKELEDLEHAKQLHPLSITEIDPNDSNRRGEFGTKDDDLMTDQKTSISESPDEIRNLEPSSTAVLPSSVERILLLRRLEEIEHKIQEHERRWNAAIVEATSSQLKSGIGKRIDEKKRLRHLTTTVDNDDAPPTPQTPIESSSWFETGMKFMQQLYHDGQMVMQKLEDTFSSGNESTSSSSSNSSSSTSFWSWPFRKEEKESEHESPENSS